MISARRSAALLVVSLVSSILLAAPLAGQAAAMRGETPAGNASADAAAAAVVTADEQTSPASPRESLRQFLELTREGRYAEAVPYLDLPDPLRSEGPKLVEELHAVLDRHVWFDLQEISGDAEGDTTDGLQPGVDQIAEIRGPNGSREPVRLARARVNGETLWRFTQGTVGRIPAWYDALEGRWAFEHLPAALLRTGPYDLLLWQWAALPLLLLLAALLGKLASRIVRGLIGRLAWRTLNEWDDALLARLGAPLTAACTLLAAGALISFLGLYQPAEAVAYRILRRALLLVFFWSLWRVVDIGRQLASRAPWAQTASSSRALIPLGARVTKAFVLVSAVVAALSLLGYRATSLIAGLGLGGLALALAAQKTVENLFGAFSIGVDQPFHEGDFVKVGDFVGTVEAIGLRSTRFRTLDRTIITLPNGKIADMQLESFTVRDRLRLATAIGLVYETTASQMRQVLEGFEAVLRAHPLIWPDAVIVRFSQFGASSLDIEIMAWFQTPDWGEFQLIRQDILLQFMEVVERAGTSIAFPTQTLHLASVPPEVARRGGARAGEVGGDAGIAGTSEAGGPNTDGGAC